MNCFPTSIIITLLLVSLLPACHPARHIGRSQTQCDSVVVTVTETVRDTVVVVQPDESMLRALVECDSLGRVHLTQLVEYRAGERLKPPVVTIRDNVLTAEAHIDSLSVYLRWRERHESRAEIHTEVVYETVEVNRLTGWQRFWMRTGQCLGMGIILLLGWKFLKFRIF